MKKEELGINRRSGKLKQLLLLKYMGSASYG